MFGVLSTGAADDLAKASDIARSMATRYAMVDTLGQVSLEDTPQSMLGTPLPPQRNYSEQTAREIDCAVRDLVGAAFERARSLLQERRAQLERGAALLLSRETLTEADLRALVAQPVPVAPPVSEPRAGEARV